ncbi:MAG TPA: exodeoxyribonuclease III, partial [Anaerolineales bacterium]|nr:exodeoxyribonuclease III [Anaerolineales bacterium]
NVNGLRAALTREIWNWVREDSPDVLCLQEIKVKPEQISSAQHETFKQYFQQILWNPAERAGYSGVATFLRDGCQDIAFGIGSERFDHEGRIIKTQFRDFSLFNVYFPNGGRDLSRLAFKLDFYAEFLDLCDQLHDRGERLIICGDFNTAHREIDLRNPKQNLTTSGFRPEERVWIDCYLDHGFIDAYRALYPDRVQYTWWTYRFGARERNIGWRLDYFLISEGLVDSISDVTIQEGVLGSDHCPVTLTLRSD